MSSWLAFSPGSPWTGSKKESEPDTGDALETVLQTTRESLTLWAQNNRFLLTRLGSNPQLASLVENQLAAPPQTRGFAGLITVKAHEKKGLEVLFDIAADVPRNLKGDSLRLRRVLVTLGSNAVKFTEAGEIVFSSELVNRIETDFEGFAGALFLSFP